MSNTYHRRYLQAHFVYILCPMPRLHIGYHIIAKHQLTLLHTEYITSLLHYEVSRYHLSHPLLHYEVLPFIFETTTLKGVLPLLSSTALNYLFHTL